MLQACAGYDPLDPASANVPVSDFSTKLGHDIKGLRLGVPRTLFADNCDKDILTAFDAAVTQMTTLGAEVVDVDSITLGELQATFWPLASADAAAYHLSDMQTRAGDYNPDLRLLLAVGSWSVRRRMCKRSGDANRSVGGCCGSWRRWISSCFPPSV